MSRAIVWFRRDLRLADNPALQAALEAGHAPVPVYIHAPAEDQPWAPGAASRAWLGRSLAALAGKLERAGSRLIIRRGASARELAALVSEAGADAVYWNRVYEPAGVDRDREVKQQLQARGVTAESFNASLLVEPWKVATLSGEPYRVFTPFWRNASRQMAGDAPLPAPTRLPKVDPLLASETIQSLGLAPRPPWDRGFWENWQPGEAGAIDLLDAFVEGAAHGYAEQRNFPDRTGSSKLSPHLHFGEVSPRQIVQRIQARQTPALDAADVKQFLAELGWREFAHHVLFHFPHSAQANLTPKFDRFAWAAVDESLLQAWQQGRTGVPLVDAGMRELWHTGWMHNRVRMVVASFLTKNLRYPWQHGARWFWDTLVDANLANNTQGWQWSAGTGADAAPYFRIFNPVTQAQRFDRSGVYIKRWLPELAAMPLPAMHAPWEHPDLARKLAPGYRPEPIVDLRASRDDALLSFQRSK